LPREILATVYRLAPLLGGAWRGRRIFGHSQLLTLLGYLLRMRPTAR
jgi:hypothetical protein